MKKSKYKQFSLFYCLHSSSKCNLVWLLVEYINYCNKHRIQKCGTYYKGGAY